MALRSDVGREHPPADVGHRLSRIPDADHHRLLARGRARLFSCPRACTGGASYALPQAPQIFKQLLMVSGFDRYFQIAPGFRDEDPRADRSPTDFYQLDMEMSFVEQEDVFATIQPVIQGVFEEFGGGHKVDAVWPRIAYRDAMLWYGTDKPDLRNPIKMEVVYRALPGLGLRDLRETARTGGTEIRAIPAQGGGSRKFCDRPPPYERLCPEGGGFCREWAYIFWRERDRGTKSAMQRFLDG